jgi:aminopeptidase
VRDERWTRLAEILVSYSTRVQPGDRVLITMMEVETRPLVEAVYEQVVLAGGFPEVQYASDWLKRILLRKGTDEQVDWEPELEAHGMEWADAYIGLRGARNPFELGDISAERLAAHRRAMGKISTRRNRLERWVLVRVPNEAFAQQAGLSLDETMAFFFDASLRDWNLESERLGRLAERFQAAQSVRIVGEETELGFSTRGRTYVAGDGRMNMPDGEIFTAPLEDSAEGTIYFELPAMYANRRIPGIRLRFEGGRVIEASSEENQDLLEQVLAIDDGARRIGEFGVGLNFGIQAWTGEVLFDEKIGGTVHLALGRAYAECGGTNHSALHWDIVKDLRTTGALYLDGEAVFQGGTYLID